MNPRQRRGLLFVLASGVVAVVVMVLLAGYVAQVRSEVGDKVTVFVAKDAIDGYSEITADMVAPVQIPAKWLTAGAVRQQSDLVGRRAAVKLSKGETITTDMLLDRGSLAPGEREIAIEVDAVTGVAGRVEPGSTVDIYAVFSDVPGLAKQVRVLVRDVRVVSVGGSEVRKDDADLTKQQTVVPVTLALGPQDALSVTYASAFAASVRLVGLPSQLDQDRSGEQNTFDAGNLGGTAIPEGGN